MDLVTLDGEVEVAKKSERAQQAKPPRSESIHFVASPEWKAWLDEFAAKGRRPIAVQIEIALELLAEKDGFRKPPKR